MYKEKGFVLVRGLVPEKLADVIREQIIHHGLKESGLDAQDPRTWGRGGLAEAKQSCFDWLLSVFASESAYSGRRIGFGRGLDRDCRQDLSTSDFSLLMDAWRLANDLASRRLGVVMDQLAGPRVWRTCRSGDILGRDLHARYGLQAKSPHLSVNDFRWPLFGWHIDGAWNLHFLGRKVPTRGQSSAEPDHACVAMLAWNKTLPHGGMTGVICGSHKENMNTIIAAEKRGGISNLWLLIRQSLFGGAAADPITLATGEQVMRAGDALLMHPYLSHSSSWNFRQCLRLGGHLRVLYTEPMDANTLLEMCRGQSREAAALGSPVPANTELLLERLGSA